AATARGGDAGRGDGSAGALGALACEVGVLQPLERRPQPRAFGTAGVVGAAGAAGGVLLLGTSGCLVALVQAVGRHAHQSPYVHTTPQPCVRQLWRRISAARCSSWRRVVPCHWTGAAPAVSSSQRGQPSIRRPKFGPWVCFVAICSPDFVQ